MKVVRTVVISLSLLLAAGQASAKVQIQGFGLYCETPGAVARVYPVLMTAFSGYGHGATPDVMNLVYTSGCGFINSGPAAVLPKGAAITEVRQFRLREGVATMVHVSFGAALTHQVESYSPDGEYLGKRPVTATSGWMLKRDVVSTPD
jgi:hypothetical protein